MGLATLMRFHHDLQVVEDAANGKEAVELARKLNPDIVVMDLLIDCIKRVARGEAVAIALRKQLLKI